MVLLKEIQFDKMTQARTRNNEHHHKCNKCNVEMQAILAVLEVLLRPLFLMYVCMTHYQYGVPMNVFRLPIVLSS